MPPKKSLHPRKPRAPPPPPNTPPNWPPLTPLIPSSSLSLAPLVPNQILLIPNFFTSKLCKDYVSFLKTLPLTTTPGEKKRGEALRVNDRFQVFDEGFAGRLWEEGGLRDIVAKGLEDGDEDEEEQANKEVKVKKAEEKRMTEMKELWGGEPIGLNPSIRIYRYTKGQFFDKHYDESNQLNLSTTPPTPAKTTWTILIYLTSSSTGCVGGETVFYLDDFMVPSKKKVVEKEVVVGLETGMCLLHRHGNECMLHEGREVTEGEKWVIRTDLCVKREKPGVPPLPQYDL